MKPILGAKFCSAFQYYKEKTDENTGGAFAVCGVVLMKLIQGGIFHLNKGLIVLEGVK